MLDHDCTALFVTDGNCQVLIAEPGPFTVLEKEVASCAPPVLRQRWTNYREFSLAIHLSISRKKQRARGHPAADQKGLISPRAEVFPSDIGNVKIPFIPRRFSKVIDSGLERWLGWERIFCQGKPSLARFYSEERGIHEAVDSQEKIEPSS